jgi:hypothetical protein
VVAVIRCRRHWTRRAVNVLASGLRSRVWSGGSLLSMWNSGGWSDGVKRLRRRGSASAARASA